MKESKKEESSSKKNEDTILIKSVPIEEDEEIKPVSEAKPKSAKTQQVVEKVSARFSLLLKIYPNGYYLNIDDYGKVHFYPIKEENKESKEIRLKCGRRSVVEGTREFAKRYLTIAIRQQFPHGVLVRPLDKGSKLEVVRLSTDFEHLRTK